MKFPSQNKLQYAQAAAVSNDAWSTFTTQNAAMSGTISSGQLNLPKDLSMLNRRGYASTDRKGVPWVYRCLVTLYAQDEDGFGYDDTPGVDFATTLKIDGAQNNWVMRNAAVKFHAAREAMFRAAGVKKGSRGAYSHEIRYNYDGASDTWIIPIDGNGDTFTGGTWDASQLSYQADNLFQLQLVGAGDDEETDAFAGGSLSIGHSYLVSRLNQQADTNLEAEEGPAKFSVLQSMLSSEPLANVQVDDDVIDTVRDEQDNPPYEVLDLSDSGDTAHDITEDIELGRCVAGLGNQVGSVVVDIPFGIARLRLTHYDQADTNVTSSPSICVEVTDIYPMQG